MESAVGAAVVPPRRPHSAPPLGQFRQFDLEDMTMDVVAAFQDGRQEEALAGAVAFSAAAKEELGETHPTYINALATVAALVSQMGAPEQAAELLQEAEDLQEEVEMEALERQLAGEIKAAAAAPPRGAAAAGGGPASGRAARGRRRSDAADGAFLTSLGGDGGGSSGSSSAGAGGGTPSAGSDGDAEGGPGQSSLDEEEEEEAARGLEALTITKLTWTVNSLLKDGRPEEAAKALSESERFLLSGSGRGAVGVVARAALHTLWAAVLDSIGEKDKARRLYSEALNCLEDDIGLGICSGSSSGGASPSDEDSDGPSCDEVDSLSDAGAPEQPAEAPTPPASPPAADAGGAEQRPPSPADTTAAPAAASRIPAETDPGTRAAPGAAAAGGAGLPGGPAAGAPGGPAGEAPAAGLRPRAPEAAPSRPGRRPCPPAAAPQAKAEAAGTAQQRSAVARCGGGFAAGSPLAPSRPKPKPKPKPGAARPGGAAARPAGARPAADSGDISVAIADEDAEGGAEAADGGAGRPAAEEGAAPRAGAGEAAAAACGGPTGALEQVAAVAQAMTCADHYMGLLDFERAADKLEEQLVALSDEACPHRGGDLHLDVLLKYGKVLSWDGDAEGAVDAFTAADEVLAERPAGEPGVQRRRAEVWMELAQALRAGGDLDGAERQLSGAVDSLEGLVAGLQIPAEPASGLLDAKARADVLDAASLVGTLREAQAALAQVCVQTRDFARAEQLYVMAFAEEEDWGQPEPQQAGGPPRPAGVACQH